MVQFTSSTVISSVDSKGRISIPIGIRAKLKLLEGSKVRLVPNGRDGVMVSTKVCEIFGPSSILGPGPFDFRAYIFDLLGTVGYKKNGKIFLSNRAENVLEELRERNLFRVLFTSANKKEIEEKTEELFDEVVLSANKRNPKKLEQIVKKLENKGYKRDEICYIGDDFNKDFLPAVKCGLNTLLLRKVM